MKNEKHMLVNADVWLVHKASHRRTGARRGNICIWTIIGATKSWPNEWWEACR